MKFPNPLLFLLAAGLIGCPEEPTDPQEQGSGDGSNPADANPNNQRWDCSSDCVTLKGTFEYDGESEATGRPQLDFTVIVSGEPPVRKHSMPLKKLGEWEVIAPREDVEGVEITVVGFIDVDQDGPSDGDPAGFDRQVVKLTEEEAAKDSPTFEGFKVTVSDDPNYTSFPGGSFGSVTPDESAGAPVLVETSNEEDGPEDEDLAEEEENAEGEDVDLPGEETDNAEPAGDAPTEEAAADEAPADEAPADGAVGAEEAAGPVAPDENDGEPVGDTTAPAEAPSN